MKYEHNANELIAAGWAPGAKRPADGAFVAYLFEPFSAVFVGYYDAESDSICGRSGFSSWDPEVLCWYPLPEKVTFNPMNDVPKTDEEAEVAIKYGKDHLVGICGWGLYQIYRSRDGLSVKQAYERSLLDMVGGRLGAS